MKAAVLFLVLSVLAGAEATWTGQRQYFFGEVAKVLDHWAKCGPCVTRWKCHFLMGECAPDDDGCKNSPFPYLVEDACCGNPKCTNCCVPCEVNKGSLCDAVNGYCRPFSCGSHHQPIKQDDGLNLCNGPDCVCCKKPPGTPPGKVCRNLYCEEFNGECRHDDCLENETELKIEDWECRFPLCVGRLLPCKCCIPDCQFTPLYCNESCGMDKHPFILENDMERTIGAVNVTANLTHHCLIRSSVGATTKKCGGTIVKPFQCLSAAHCFTDLPGFFNVTKSKRSTVPLLDGITLFMGDFISGNYNEYGSDELEGVVFNGQHIGVTRDVDIHYDLGVLSVLYGPWHLLGITPICVYFSGNIRQHMGKAFIVTYGDFGFDIFANFGNDNVPIVEVDLITVDLCAELVNLTKYQPPLEHELLCSCTKDKSPELYDDGGGLVVPCAGRLVLIGVYLDNPPNMPNTIDSHCHVAVYARIDEADEWLLENTGGPCE